MTDETAYPIEDIQRWQRAVAPYARPAPPLDPAQSVFLVVDMQRYFAAMCSPILAAVNRAARTCRERGMPVCFTRHGHADPRMDGGLLGQWWGQLIREGSADHPLLEELKVQPQDRVVPKRRYSAFYETELERLLAELGVTDLVVAGVMTNLCVETTVRDAFVRDLRVRVLMDGTATASKRLHQGSLVSMAYGFAHVRTTDELLAELG